MPPLPLPPPGTYADPALTEGEFKSALEAQLAAVTELQSGGGGGGGNTYLGVPLTPLDQAAWSWVNQAGAVVTQLADVVILTSPSSGTSIHARVTAVPATPWTITALVVGRHRPNGGNYGGLCVRESSTGKLIILYVLPWQNRFQSVHFTNPTTFASVMLDDTLLFPTGPYWLRITDDGTMLRAAFSQDGRHFHEYGAASRTAFLAGGPDQVGIFGNVDGSSGEFSMSYLSWVQG